MMTKMNFEALAAAINETASCFNGDMTPDSDNLFAQGQKCAIRWVARDVAKVCAASNPNFDKDRFLKACGVTEA